MKKKRLKILFLVGAFGVGGKERQLAEIIKNLPKHEFEVFLFSKTIEAHYLDANTVSDKITESYTVNRGNFSPADIFKLKQFIDKVSPDVVFTFSPLLSHAALMIKTLTCCNFVLINGSIRTAPDPLNLKQKLEGVLYNLYPFVVANSVAGLSSYNQLHNKGRYVLYNGFSEQRLSSLSKEEARKALGLEATTFYVLMVSSLRKDFSKDPVTFLKTAKIVLKTDDSIKFLLAGDGERLKECKDYIKDNQLSNVQLLGNRSDVELLFKASDLSVLTSKTEGVSNSILESMACGRPVIATSGGGTKEIVEDGVSGFITPFGNAEVLAQKILLLKDTPTLLLAFSERCLNQYKNKFSVRAMIEQFRKIIDDCMMR